MPAAPQGITIEPNGQTVVVTFTESGGGTPTAYTTRHGTATVALPATISSRTTFFFTDPTSYTVSCKVGGLENANGSGGTTTVDLSGGGIGTIGVGVPVETPTVASGTYTQVFKAEAYGTVDTTGAADSYTAVMAAIEAAYDAGGGVVELPQGTIKCASQITMPNDAATPAKQPTIILRGKGCHWSGRGTAPVGGTRLDLTYSGTQGKIRSNGLGLLVVEHLTFKDSAGTTTPFLYTTNTTLHVQDSAFVGSKSGVLCDQDAIILGGTTAVEGGNGWDDGFQGYGTVIEKSFFSGIRRAVYGRTYCNAVVIRDNTAWTTCGSNLAAGACIEIDGGPATCTGNVISDNLIEVPNYPYAIKLSNAQRNMLAFNHGYDPSAPSLAVVRMESTAPFNTVLAGFSAGTQQYLSDASLSSTYLNPSQSVASVLSQPTLYINQTMPLGVVTPSGLGPRGYHASGDAAGVVALNGPFPYSEAQIATWPPVSVADGVTTNGSAVVTSATAAWTLVDVGMPIKGTGIPNGTVILSRQSATQVTLSANCTATATGVTFTFGRITATVSTQIGFNRQHIIGKGTAPSPSVNAGAGTGATVSLAGTDTAFTLTLTTGTGPASGQQCTIGAGTNWQAAAKYALTAKNAAAGVALGGRQMYITNTTSNTLLFAGIALDASTAYIFDFLAIQ